MAQTFEWNSNCRELKWDGLDIEGEDQFENEDLAIKYFNENLRDDSNINKVWLCDSEGMAFLKLKDIL
jgi:hypothetical protein